MSSEREMIERIRRHAAANPANVPGLKLGIGDDCAVYQPTGGEDLVFTTDFLIENVHFRRATHAPEDVGHLALARGLSDLAAMGAMPRFCLLSLALPPWADSVYGDRFFSGLLGLAEKFQCALAGGDLAAAPILICDIVACGSVPKDRALRRNGAKDGDEIWVTGPLGGSALGLTSGPKSGAAWRKHIRPTPLVAHGRALIGRATAAMDLSDGLSIDLARMAEASGLAAEIESPPVFDGATLTEALHGGEDYELLFTLPAGAELPGDAEVSGALWAAAARIGRMTAGEPGRVTMGGSTLDALGYDHFRSR